jgi:hypothetical protein
MASQKGVIPAKAGIQLFDNILKILDSCLRRNDLAGHFSTFCETIIIGRSYYSVAFLPVSDAVYVPQQYS